MTLASFFVSYFKSKAGWEWVARNTFNHNRLMIHQKKETTVHPLKKFENNIPAEFHMCHSNWRWSSNEDFLPGKLLLLGHQLINMFFGFSLDYESFLRSGKVFCYGFVTDLLSLPESIIHIIGIFQQFFRLLSSSSVLSEWCEKIPVMNVQ